MERQDAQRRGAAPCSAPAPQGGVSPGPQDPQREGRTGSTSAPHCVTSGSPALTLRHKDCSPPRLHRVRLAGARRGQGFNTWRRGHLWSQQWPRPPSSAPCRSKWGPGGSRVQSCLVLTRKSGSAGGSPVCPGEEPNQPTAGRGPVTTGGSAAGDLALGDQAEQAVSGGGAPSRGSSRDKSGGLCCFHRFCLPPPTRTLTKRHLSAHLRNGALGKGCQAAQPLRRLQGP